jgi:four helix bundle protein
MARFYHQRLTVFQRALECVELADELAQAVPPRWTAMADQIRRAALSVPANIAEGAADFSEANRKRHYRIAKGSAAESAAYIEVMRRGNMGDAERLARIEEALYEVICMLTALITRQQ